LNRGISSSSSKTTRKTSKARRIAVIDLETDPFQYGRLPQAFAAGFYDGARFVHFWGDDCLRELVAFLDAQPEPLALFAHNGGRFDFFFLLDYLQNPLKIIAGRIVTARLGKHQLRDSFAILPVPLASYEKTVIDYARFERGERERHRAEIVDYLRDDCVALHELVSAFEGRFGRALTVASTAIKQLQVDHATPRQDAEHDAMFRPFYFGGRVECFAAGIHRGDWQIADVNSMYPHAMANFDHPAGGEYRITTALDLDDPRCAFAIVDAESCGALPVRTKEGLTFPHTRGRFLATAHELRAGVETGLLRIEGCARAYYSARTLRFDGFVAAWMAEKIDAEKRGDKAGRLFAKLILNSAYGKFAQNPEAFADFMLRRPHEPIPKDWDLYADHGFVEVWKRPALGVHRGYFDVATAASITGASRAELLRAIARADRPLYCDTDSLICADVRAEIHATKLGAWKIEERADTCAIAGKKLYACAREGQYVKWASKGVKISPETIFDIAAGNVYKYLRESPSYTLATMGRFINRQVKATT
jgi:hypothetical protein